MKRLFLIDGHSLIFRMYYALLRRPMINSKGEDTSILYGFTKYLLELIQREQPTHLAVAFDPPCKTFRHEIFSEYKGNRSETPELVKAALSPLIEIMETLGVAVVMKNGVEADDVIGTLACNAQKEGFDVYMVTPDKDLGQIVSDHIYQYKPGKSGADNEILSKKDICEKYGIEDPIGVVDILTLWGDSADNIKGVAGIGEVGAKKLIGKYKSVENIYNHLEDLSQKQRDSFLEAKESIGITKLLVTIKTDVDLNTPIESLHLNLRGNSKVSEMISRYEFGSLRSFLLKNSDSEEKIERVVEKKNGFDSKQVSKEDLLKEINSEVEFESGKRFVSIRLNKSVIFSHGNKYTICSPSDQFTKLILEDRSISKIGHNLKADIVKLLDYEVVTNGDLYDVEIMHYLLDPERTHKLDILARGYLDIDLDSVKEEKKVEVLQMDIFSAAEMTIEEESDNSSKVAQEAIIAEQLYKHIRKELEEDNLWDLYKRIEMPLIEILADMEHTGVKIDPDQLAHYGDLLSKDLIKIQEDVEELSGVKGINLSSPKQVGVLLYEKLNLNPKVKKTKRDSYPTDEQTLTTMADLHPVVNKILDFRGVKKLLSTYIDPLPSLINPHTGKIHTTFNQALTATGRLSSVRPNLQNIPIRTEQGREIRKAFVPSAEEGYIVSADYSQIELRLMAELSADPELLKGFAHGADVHTATAAKVFKVAPEEVTKEQRSKAKVANFGIIYGISPFGLAQRLKIPRREASDLIDGYFISYPKVKEYMNNAIEKGKSQGYVQTIFLRKRYLSDILSKNPAVRSLGERNAINAPIQGSAADIIKLSMINVYRALKEKGLKSKMVLQVHDELVFDVLPQERDIVMEIVKYEMENVVKLSIPLIVECSYGKNWLEAH